MFRSKRVPIFVVIVAMVVPLIASRAGASDETDNDNGGPNSATVLIKGVETFRPNFFQQTFRFPEDPTEIKSGGTITWKNMTADGHTMSLIEKADLPTSANGNNDVANALFGLHNVGNGPGQFNLVVDAGVANDDDTTTTADETAPQVTNFDTAGRSTADPNKPVVGDSVLIDAAGANNHGGPSTVSVKVTAPAGTVFHYFCIFHQQMQGSIQVVG
jgi:plastocyanin